MTKPIDSLFGVERWTILGAFMSGFIWSFVECPFEYVKVN